MSFATSEGTLYFRDKVRSMMKEYGFKKTYSKIGKYELYDIFKPTSKAKKFMIGILPWKMEIVKVNYMTHEIHILPHDKKIYD